MSEREIPKTDHDLLISLWTFMVGTNGNGLIAKFDDFAKCTDERLDAIERRQPEYWTKADHVAAEKEYAAQARDRIDRRKLSRRDMVMIAVTALGSLAAAGAVIVAIIS